MRKNGLHKDRLPMIDGNLEFSWEFGFQNNKTIGSLLFAFASQQNRG